MNKINFKKQKGVALAIGIMLLLIVSMIGITSMKSAMMQEKMASGLKSREYADAAALDILKAGERYLNTYYRKSNNTTLSPGIGPVVEARSQAVYDMKTNRNLNDGYSHPYNVDLKSEFGGGLAENPKYIIEDLNSGSDGNNYLETGGEDNNTSPGESLDVKKYRVISKATDSSGNLFSGYESVVSVLVK